MTYEKQAVIYCRVSTKEQVEEGSSLATQERICRDYAAKNDYGVAEIFIELGESAKTADRTQLQKLLKYCAHNKGKIQAVIAYKIDRISRNTYDYSHLRLLLKRYGVEIKSTSENIDDTPAGRFMENIIANVAQFDNEVRTERSVGGMKEAIRNGRYVGRAPTGYSNAKVNGKSNIVPNEQAKHIKMVFEEIAAGSPISQAYVKAAKAGLRSSSNKRVQISHFYKIVRNEVYAGWINQYGERHRGLFDPIISEETFALVQYNLRNYKRTPGAQRKEITDFSLRRFVKSQSGSVLTGSWSKGKSKKYPYYRFRGSKDSIRKDSIEATFAHFLDQFGYSTTLIPKLVAAIKKNLGLASEKVGDKKKQIISEIELLKQREDTLIQKNLDGVISDGILREQLNRIHRNIGEFNLELNKEITSKSNFNWLGKVLIEFLTNPGSIWLKASFRQKIELEWFVFPTGVIYENSTFRTPKLCSIFKLKEIFEDINSTKVTRKESTSNTHQNVDSPAAVSWEEIYADLANLNDLLSRKENQTHSP